MRTVDEINKLLEEQIPREQVATRSGGGGKSLSYFERHTAVQEANRIFGNLNWSMETLELKQVDSENRTYIARVRVYVDTPDGRKVYRDGVGYGSDKGNFNPHELAAKEAETDALKRALALFGGRLGNYLYDKTQENISDEIITSTTTNGRGASAQTESGGANSTAPAKANGRAGSGASNRKSASLSNTKRELIRAAATTLNEMGVIDLASFKKEFILTKGVDSLDQMQDTDIEALLTTVTTKYPQLQLN